MALRVRAFALATCFGIGAATSTNWTRVFIDQSEGAACLDGTPPVYYIKPGVGENASKFVMFFEGGG